MVACRAIDPGSSPGMGVNKGKKMGKYNINHKLHYVCIECKIGSKSMEKTLKCPHCAKPMYEVHVTFRIPKKTDKKAWKVVSSAIRTGRTYASRWWSR